MQLQPHNERKFDLLLFLGCLTFIIWYFLQISSGITEITIPFDTDEADHANAALELYTAIKRFDLSQVFYAITRQSFYPPVHSVFTAISYLITEPSLVASRIPSMIFFAAYIALLMLAVAKYTKRLGGSVSISMACSAVAGIAAASSPISAYNAVLCMLEIPGLFFTSLCILAFMSYEKSASRTNIILVCLAGLSVFFTKYNFGIITLPALGLTIFLNTSKPFRFKEQVNSCIFPAGFLLGVIFFWWLLIDKASFLHFFSGHNSYAPRLSQENLLFELRSWLKSYCADSYLAALLLVLALYAAKAFWGNAAARFAALNTFFAFLILAISTTNEERHFMVALPTIIFLASIGLFSLTRGLASKSFAPSAWIIYTFSAVCMFSAYKHYPDVKVKLDKQYEGEPGFSELYDFINSSVDSHVPIIVNGVSDDFGPETLRWMVAKHGQIAYSEAKVDSYPFRADKNFTARKRKRNLDKPFADKDFPQKPASRVLATGYYKYAIRIKNLIKEQRFKKEADEFFSAVSSFPAKSKTVGSREITVYNLISPPQ